MSIINEKACTDIIQAETIKHLNFEQNEKKKTEVKCNILLSMVQAVSMHPFVGSTSTKKWAQFKDTHKCTNVLNYIKDVNASNNKIHFNDISNNINFIEARVNTDTQKLEFTLSQNIDPFPDYNTWKPSDDVWI
jgi:hypothetical protein